MPRKAPYDEFVKTLKSLFNPFCPKCYAYMPWDHREHINLLVKK